MPVHLLTTTGNSFILYCVALSFTSRAIAFDPLPAPMSSYQTAVAVGICPESLVVADVHEHTQAILSRVDSAIELRTALTVRISDVRSASEVVALAAQLLAEATSNSESLAQHAAAMAALSNATALLEEVRHEILVHATEGLSEESVQLLAHWNSTAQFGAPAEYSAHQRSQDEWRSIEGALRAKRRAERLGQSLLQAHAELLAEVNAEFDVAAARIRLETSLESTREFFEQLNGTPE